MEEKSLIEAFAAEEQSPVAPEVMEAVACHQKIIESAKLAGTSLMEMGKALKTMRDKKLYLRLGYESFGQYVEQNGEYSFKERQAYTYIKAVESFSGKFLEEHGDIGITKIELLTALSEQDAVEVIESGDLAGMNVDEVKALVREKQALGEQLTFWKEEAKTAKDDLTDTEDQLEALKKKIEEIEAMKRKAAVQAEKSAEQLRKAKEKHKGEIAKLNAEIEMIKAEQSAEPTEEQRREILESAEEKHKAELAALKAEYAAKVQAAEVEKQALADKLKNGTPDEARAVLRVYFTEMQQTVGSFIEKIAKTPDPESRNRFITGTVRWLEGVIEDLGEM